MGLGTAVMTIVGNRVGSGNSDQAVRSTWLAFGFSSVLIFMFSTVCLLAPDIALAPFNIHAEEGEWSGIADMVRMLLRFVVVYSFFDAMAVVFSSAIRGAGDTRFSLLFTTISCWTLMVIPTFIALRYLNAGLYAGWFCITLYIIVLGIGFLWRFQHGKWRTMSVLEDGIAGLAAGEPTGEKTLPNDPANNSEMPA